MSREGSSLARWNCFGHLSEQAPHGGFTGGRVAFSGTRNAFDDTGCPVGLQAMGREIRAMGIDGSSDDELVDDAGVSAEFYGTSFNGTHLGSLPALSDREPISWCGVEDALLAETGHGTVADLRRFMQSKVARRLDQDDRTYIWSVLNEHGKCETPDDVAAIEGLIETIEKHLARARQRAEKAAEAEAKAETPKVKARPAMARSARPAPTAKPTAPKAEAKPVERKPEDPKGNDKRAGRRHGRRHGKGSATQTKPAPWRHNGLVFVPGEHRGQTRFECRHGSRLFVWDRKLSEQPVAGQSYDCVEVQVIAKGQLLVLAVKPL